MKNNKGGKYQQSPLPLASLLHYLQWKKHWKADTHGLNMSPSHFLAKLPHLHIIRIGSVAIPVWFSSNTCMVQYSVGEVTVYGKSNSSLYHLHTCIVAEHPNLKGCGPDYVHDRRTLSATPRKPSLWLPVAVLWLIHWMKLHPWH